MRDNYLRMTPSERADFERKKIQEQNQHPVHRQSSQSSRVVRETRVKSSLFLTPIFIDDCSSGGD